MRADLRLAAADERLAMLTCATYASITEMPRRKQRELLEVVLMTESDAALKVMIEDSLADDMDFQELAGILEEAECICSEGDI